MGSIKAKSGPSYVKHAVMTVKISRWLTMKKIAVERFMAGRSSEMEGK